MNCFLLQAAGGGIAVGRFVSPSENPQGGRRCVSRRSPGRGKGGVFVHTSGVEANADGLVLLGGTQGRGGALVGSGSRLPGREAGPAVLDVVDPGAEAPSAGLGVLTR